MEQALPLLYTIRLLAHHNIVVNDGHSYIVGTVRAPLVPA